MRLKAIGLAMMLAIATAGSASSARAADGQCLNREIQAGALTPEVAENTPAQTEVKVSGVLTLTNPSPKRKDKASVTLVIRVAGKPDVERHVSIPGDSTHAVAYVLKEDSSFFAVAVESNMPLVCESSDVVY